MEINDSIQEKTNALYEESEEIHQCLKEAEERVELVSLLREHHTANRLQLFYIIKKESYQQKEKWN